MISLEKPKNEADWNKVVSAVIDGVVALSTGKIISIYTTAKKLRSDEMKAPPSDGELAWNWVQAVAAETAAWMLLHDRVKEHLAAEAVRKAAVKKFLERAMAFDDGCELVAEHFLYPERFAAFENGRAAAHAFLTAAAPDHRIKPDEAAELFNQGSARQAGRVQNADPGLFHVLMDRLEGRTSERERRLLAWDRHGDWIRGLYELQPIFGQEPDSGITLARTYLPLRCFRHVPVPPKKVGEKVDEWVAHVGMLHETVRAALDDPKGPQLQLVAGSPGCGKSSFSWAFAVELIEACRTGARARNVLLVRLQNFRFRDDLAAALADHLARCYRPLSDRGGEGLPGDPLSWLKDGDRQLVILFDGLDELSHDKATAEAHTDDFVKSVQTLFRDWTPEELRVVVLGRPAACQKAADVARLDDDRVLHLLPMRALPDPVFAAKVGRSDRMQVLSLGRALRRVEDPDALLLIDQRETFYLRNAACLGLPAEVAPKAVTHNSMEALNSEPLLLYLLMITGYTGEGWKAAQGNPNIVYEEIFRRVYQRDAARRPADVPPLSEADFFTLMECLGLASWQRQERTGSEEEYLRIRELHADEEQAERFESDPLSSLKNVAVQTYTRSDLGGSAGFEFVHRSFGEYLVARALMAAAGKLARNPSLSRYAKFRKHAAVWERLVGQGELTHPIIDFLQREELLDRATAHPRLQTFLHYAVQDGFPVHSERGAASWMELAGRERSALVALVAVMSATVGWARAVTAGATKDAGEAGFFLTFQPYSRDAVVGDKPTLNVERLLERIEATGQGIASRLLAWTNLSQAQLSGASLSGANLFEANLRGANLSRADLAWAQLARADLAGADLSGAELGRAQLDGANLFEANLSGAKLGGANLIQADLGVALLNGANLRRAELGGANLSGASLNEADLVGADLRKAKLSGAKLIEADLRGANLDEVNLNGAKLRWAKLSGAYLGGAKLIEADLSQAKLMEADLRGVNLFEANLIEADLSGANLRGAKLRSANCKRLRIQSAKLDFADLSQAENFPWDRLATAGGNAQTILPEGVERPCNWAVFS
ncbi:pentapeptide repeat-containing protein [Rhodovulum sp. DZ06]|uniref:pentapeptide repeat-containing protein n=1 Tax=Rhodovulum sp. DZ06 TaxID=3425126 RepID=UPI003D356406